MLTFILGLKEDVLFSPSDLVFGANVPKVIGTLEHLATLVSGAPKNFRPSYTAKLSDESSYSAEEITQVTQVIVRTMTPETKVNLLAYLC